ncbi:MAG: Fe-S cluster protein [Candidatus Aureabacteria bacterium]|nr:Fe-S cluster protein [Candidatus Auribacterota bacterium]
MKLNTKWSPPGKNCGLCGVKTCREFMVLVRKGKKLAENCVFFVGNAAPACGTAKNKKPHMKKTDILGNKFDFVINPLPGEVSARKIILPFRPDIVEKWKIKKGDIVVGRPEGAGCPVQHVLQVIKASKTTGVIDTWCVGPRYSRNKKVFDVEAYHMIAFEGIAEVVRKEPQFGRRQYFLPGFCMMNMAHTGVVNMVIKKPGGLQIRVEDIRFL